MLLLVASAHEALSQPNDRIEVAGQSIFMSGGNVAWVNFARDIGPTNTNLTV